MSSCSDARGPAHVLATTEDHRRLTGGTASIIDMLAMPDAADIEFEPRRVHGPLSRPADLA